MDKIKMPSVTPINPTEGRLHARHKAKTLIFLKPEGATHAIMKRAANLSANGVGVLTEDMGLKKGQKVELSFSINLGIVTKIHRRTAKVAHVTAGVTGFMMDRFGA